MTGYPAIFNTRYSALSSWYPVVSAIEEEPDIRQPKYPGHPYVFFDNSGHIFCTIKFIDKVPLKSCWFTILILI